MLRNWRFWVLAILLAGPPSVLVFLGFRWLNERDWGLYGAMIWLVAGTIFGSLSVVWTKTGNPILPPIDWQNPRTFSPRDVTAWQDVKSEAEAADSIPAERFSTGDLYIDVGRRLADSIAKHYHPESSHSVEHVAVVDILAALELAAEDLGELCREIPGGDMVTPSHWRKAVQAAGYISKANEFYNYLLPLIQPAYGIARLGAAKMLTQPAWKHMQQNVMRWFYRAYVNRLGVHLIELYSGRLGIGADQYRRLTGRSPDRKLGDSPDLPTLVVAVAGARDAGKSALIAAIETGRAEELPAVRARLERSGLDESLVKSLRSSEFREVEGYTIHETGEVARDRYTRRDAVKDAVESDLLLLAIHPGREDLSFDAKFVEDWLAYYEGHPELEIPPVLAILVQGNGEDRERTGPEAGPPPEPIGAEAVRKALPASVTDVVVVDLGEGSNAGVTDRLLPELAALLHRAERVALIRHLQRHVGQSKARRLVGQVGRGSKRLWSAVRKRGSKAKSG